MDPLLVTGGIAPAIEAEAAAVKRRRTSGSARTSSTVVLTASLVNGAWTSGWGTSSMVGSLPWPSSPSPDSPSPDSVTSERSSVVGSVGGSCRALLPLVRLILDDLDDMATGELESYPYKSSSSRVNTMSYLSQQLIFK